MDKNGIIGRKPQRVCAGLSVRFTVDHRRNSNLPGRLYSKQG